MSKNRYDTERAKVDALKALNDGFERISQVQRMLKEIDKSLQVSRLDIIYSRRVTFGAGKGKTGKARGESSGK
jgi:hypothetical protein